jgi:hypothetical protein
MALQKRLNIDRNIGADRCKQEYGKELKKQNPVLLKAGLMKEYRKGVVTNARAQIPGQH